VIPYGTCVPVAVSMYADCYNPFTLLKDLKGNWAQQKVEVATSRPLDLWHVYALTASMLESMAGQWLAQPPALHLDSFSIFETNDFCEPLNQFTLLDNIVSFVIFAFRA